MNSGLYAAEEYPRLSRFAVKKLLIFTSTYLCETAFSVMSLIKTRHRNRLDQTAAMRVALSKIPPRIDELAREIQDHTNKNE